MVDYVERALFVYGEGFEGLLAGLRSNTAGTEISAISCPDFVSAPESHIGQIGHVVLAGEVSEVKQLLRLAAAHGVSVGFLATKGQRVLREAYGLPMDPREQVELALRGDPAAVDLVTCNGELVILRAVLGRLPLVEAILHRSRFQVAVHALKELFSLKLLGMRVETAEGRSVQTAACGCTIVQRFERARVSRVFSRSNSLSDGMVSLLLVAPMSVTSYVQSFLNMLSGKTDVQRVPATMGYIRSAGVKVRSDVPLPVSVDGTVCTSTPLTCEVQPGAVRLNVGHDVAEKRNTEGDDGELVEVKHLPAGKELRKAQGQRIPLFAYASEERFRDLFAALREDAHINGTYIVLMLLSALLATIGLFLSSSSVVIGAMLLAPLMAPIMSLSMGLVRQDDRLALRSIRKILVGIAIALGTAALFSVMIAHKPVTAEMSGRLNPSLLDLAVAIVAGLAAAYTKSFKEILQSLAGVAIAVALVPPLAVAGIGLGRGDLLFFSQAFLLFLTNLMGITLSAAVAFRVLGYSPAVRNRRGLALVVLMLIAVSVPLFLSYRTIVKTEKLEANWRRERFLVGGKYLIVEKAELRSLRDQHVLYVDVLAREQLTRRDLATFKQKVQIHFSQRLIVRVRVIYIL